MDTMLIPVDVADPGLGVFKSERAISFEAGGERYELIVDETDLQGSKLKVYLVARKGDEALIDLPRETFTSGYRIRIPYSLLQPA